MTQITGRPKEAVRQEKFLGFFVKKVEHFIIQQKAAKARVNMPDYLRQVAINGQVKVRWTEEELQMLRSPVNMGLDYRDICVRAVIFLKQLK